MFCIYLFINHYAEHSPAVTLCTAETAPAVGQAPGLSPE